MTDRGWFEHPLPAPKDAATEILWLHGWGQTGASLMGLAGLFAARARNRVVDLPGFGNTPMLRKVPAPPIMPMPCISGLIRGQSAFWPAIPMEGAWRSNMPPDIPTGWPQ
ncbi:hypothetical protein JCM17845_28150 [Iodidimonas gelatinilytica]|uniref:Alpha/beta hydrolase n=1 Tax=Iodidimonas gelatinilytica TaxID=1236966 RepID=A0A5A7N1P2_9PROT|nr:hypothetical protein JCM17845_28150 [Iodidimonas gelatinilytica]